MKTFQIGLILFSVLAAGCNRYEVVAETYERPEFETGFHYRPRKTGRMVLETDTVKVDKYSGRSWVLRGETWQPRFYERTWGEWWKAWTK